MLRQEMKDNVEDAIREKLQIPGLIGDGQPYRSLANYLTSNNNQVGMDIMTQKTRHDNLKARVDAMENTMDAKGRLIDDNKKDFISDINRVDRENERMRTMINTSRLSLEKLVRESTSFSQYDAKRLRSLVDHDFPAMQRKVNNLAQEVFDEVVEHEMALTGLTNINLEQFMVEADPSTAEMASKKSLLRRMTTI